MRILTTSLRPLRERQQEMVKTSRETNTSSWNILTSSREGIRTHSWLHFRMVGFYALANLRIFRLRVDMLPSHPLVKQTKYWLKAEGLRLKA